MRITERLITRIGKFLLISRISTEKTLEINDQQQYKNNNIEKLNTESKNPKKHRVM